MYKTATTFLKRFFKVSTIYKYGFNWSPMYRRSTAKLIHVSDDLHHVRIKIPFSYKNRNYAGSIFGGSMLSATDPIYMIQFIQILGDDYVIWDKSASIKYKRPAKESIYADFIVTPEEVKQIKADVATHNEVDFTKTLHLINEEKTIFAEVEKTLYIATKSHYKTKLKARKQKLKAIATK